MASHEDDICRLRAMHEGLAELAKCLNVVLDQLLPIMSQSQFIYAKVDCYKPQLVGTSYMCTVDSLKKGTEQLLETVCDADNKLWNANQNALVLIEEVGNAMTECRGLDAGDTTPTAPSTPTAPNLDWKK